MESGDIIGKYKNINYNSTSMKKIVFLLSILILIPFLTAETSGGDLTAQQNACIDLPQECANCTFINITTITLPDLNKTSLQTNMTQDGTSYSYEYCDTSQLGIYSYCVLGDVNGQATVACNDFLITPNGKEMTITSLTAHISLLIFFFILILTFFFIARKVDYENWQDKIISKYEERNFVRVIIGSIGYNFLKNKFIWYYLMGLPILLVITNISYLFDVESMVNLMEIILAIYYYGFLLVIAFFFGFVFEWIRYIMDEVKKMDFGVR